MISIRRARVLGGDGDHLHVELLEGPLSGGRYPAIHYPEFGGTPRTGEQVLVNAVGLEMGLGTGGMAFVMPPDGGDVPANSDHFVKLPYTPLQFPVTGSEIPEDLGGSTVVVLPLHSHLAVACCAVRDLLPGAEVAFVWHEGGSLAAGSSRAMESLRAEGLLDFVVSAGNCFGGDAEEPNVFAALLAASGADVVLCGIGPGIVGSARPYAHGGMSAAIAANAAASLGGSVISCPRVSATDPRERHVGVSHHTRQALGATLAPCRVPVPQGVEATAFDGLPERHEYVGVGYGAGGLEERFGVTFESMGRSYTDDPVFFDAAAAAVSLAVSGREVSG